MASEETLDKIWEYVDAAYQIARSEGLDEISTAISAASAVVLAAYDEEAQA